MDWLEGYLVKWTAREPACLAENDEGMINRTNWIAPFKIDLSSEVPHLLDLANKTRLPLKPLYPDAGLYQGIELDYLRELQTAMGSTITTVVIEGQTVHFVHQKSDDPDAIPLILLHRWPGSFYEFSLVIKPLTESWTSATGKNVSYHVVVPSLPGFVFSSPPPRNWTVDDDARIFNTLMTEVLGYSTFAVHGTDWGSVIGYSLYSEFTTTTRAAHFVFLPFFPPTAEDIAANNITLSDEQKVTLQRGTEWFSTGIAYLMEQENKPNDIGLALYDSPVGQLAWLGGLNERAKDPRAGTPPSVLNDTAFLTLVSLYYLTNTFYSSLWIYAQNPNGFRGTYTKANTDAPMLFSQFEYTNALWPQEYVAKVGNLVSYKFHNFGGHIAGLDNPPAIIEDIREMGPIL
ncbi:Alpha/Beta hydrolase protein [Mycena olivaceomarginata]|nr:Alpha/Beta hydrolase protein [Mycena olivaceomarginata]